MKIIKCFNNPNALILTIIMGLTGCAADINSRSQSYANDDVNIPTVRAADEKTTEAGVFRSVSAYPESIVSLNVDTNSYGNLRRVISRGEIPSTVRLAEWVNYFDYDYPKPQGSVPFRVTTEVAPAPWNESSKLLLIGIAASSLQATEPPANNIVVLIDISEGMDNSAVVSLIKASLKELTDALRPQDKISFVSYSSMPIVIMEPTAGNEKSAIERGIKYIDFGLETTPSGAVGSVNLAYTVLENSLINNGNNSIIFITDGDLGANPNGIRSIERAVARKKDAGLTFSTLVFNVGKYNYQAMQRLADLGNGVHAYVDTLNEANRVMRHQLASSGQTVAQPVELKVVFDPNHVRTYRLLGYEKNNVRTIRRDGRYANALKDGQTFTALYEIQTIESSPPQQPHKYNEMARISLNYKQPSQPLNQLLELSVVPAQVKTSLNRASKDFSFAAAVAAFALQLRNDINSQHYSLDEIISLANSAVGKDELGLRAEFVYLLESLRSLNAAKNGQ